MKSLLTLVSSLSLWTMLFKRGLRTLFTRAVYIPSSQCFLNECNYLREIVGRNSHSDIFFQKHQVLTEPIRVNSSTSEEIGLLSSPLLAVSSRQPHYPANVFPRPREGRQGTTQSAIRMQLGPHWLAHAFSGHRPLRFFSDWTNQSCAIKRHTLRTYYSLDNCCLLLTIPFYLRLLHSLGNPWQGIWCVETKIKFYHFCLRAFLFKFISIRSYFSGIQSLCPLCIKSWNLHKKHEPSIRSVVKNSFFLMSLSV